jgi:hypothetical protein
MGHDIFRTGYRTELYFKKEPKSLQLNDLLSGKWQWI